MPMHDLQRAKVTRRTQRAQATKIWNKAEPLLEGDLDEVKIQHLQVILETYDAKIEQYEKLMKQYQTRSQTKKRLEPKSPTLMII